MRMAFQYCIEGREDEVFDLPNIHDIEVQDLTWLAEKAAADYYDSHGGWEDDWPLTFIILDLRDKELGRCQVEVEPRPEFTATLRIEKAKEERDLRRYLQTSNPPNS